MSQQRGELSREEKALKEAEKLAVGPLSVLTSSVASNTQILISLRNNKKIIAHVKAFDRHFNVVLENVRLIWSEAPKTKKGKKKAKPAQKERFVSKMFLRGENIIIVVKNQLAKPTVE